MPIFFLGRKSRIVSAVLLILFIYGVVNFLWNSSDIRATISKETTRITEPLGPDGYPDYVAALNRLADKGVTPENNAAVLFWRAMGPDRIDQEYRVGFWKLLGIPPLPEKGDYFVALDKYAERADGAKAADDPGAMEKRMEKLWEEHGLATRRPWSKREFPTQAGWLAANDKPLALVIQASKRPRWYDPMMGDNVMEAALSGTQAMRSVVRALSARATLRLDEGRLDDAWEDVLTCHRLARLMGQCPRTAVEFLVAITIEHIAIAGDCAILQQARLTPAQIAKMRGDLARLSPMPKMVETIDVGERYMCLDSVIGLARQRMAKGDKKAKRDQPPQWVTSRSLDWGLMLRMSNAAYDRMVAAMRKPTRDERKKALDELDRSMAAETAAIKSWKTLAAGLINRRETVSRVMGQILTSLFLPADLAINDAQDRITMMMQLDDLAFALAAYRAEHGSYPAKLADLAPKHIARVPKDLFGHDADLHYRREKDGYLLYSVGVNGKDDGGQGMDDRKSGDEWDDLTIRVPAAGRMARP